ncbi:uncharacterized protein TNCV_3134161 [Trichonephila clavipes]|nr:uncharacterized protein TNCV_3134161 [Trichonephila clavipes]
MNPDSVYTTEYPIRHLLSMNVTVWGAISWDIIFSGPSRHFDSSQIRGRYFNADCATMLSSRPGAIYSRPHTARLSQQCLQGYDVLPWPARSPDLSPIEHVLGRLQPSRDTRRINCADAKTMAGSSTGVISDLKSMPRRISACIAAEVALLLTDF